jgi:hypothetical protein
VVPVLGPERAAGLTVEGERGDLPPRGVVVGAHVALQRELLEEPRVRRRRSHSSRAEQSEGAQQSEDDGTPRRHGSEECSALCFLVGWLVVSGGREVQCGCAQEEEVPRIYL